MPVSAQFKVFVAELFEPFGHVSVRAMFGGAGIFLDGIMFGLVADERIYLKVDDESRKAFEAAGSEPFVFEMKSGEVVAMSYLELPADAYDDPGALREWVRRAYDVALRSPTAERKRRKRLREGAARKRGR